MLSLWLQFFGFGIIAGFIPSLLMISAVANEAANKKIHIPAWIFRTGILILQKQQMDKGVLSTYLISIIFVLLLVIFTQYVFLRDFLIERNLVELIIKETSFTPFLLLTYLLPSYFLKRYFKRQIFR